MSKYSKLKQMSEIDIQLKKLEKAIDKTSFLFEDEDVYFHELVHFAQQKIFGDLVSKSDEAKYNENEVVAQLGACVLANLYGIDVQGFTYQYIAEYIGNKKPEAVGKACVQVLSKVGKILNFILKTDEELNGGEKEVQ